MRELWILGGFFLAVLAGTGCLGYLMLFRGQVEGNGESPLVGTLRRIGRATPVRRGESDRLSQRLSLAGYREAAAAAIYSGIRMASAGLLGLVMFGAVTYHAQSLYRA